MTSEKLKALIEKEEKNLEKYRAKKAEYDEKIRKSEVKLNEYKMIENSEKLNALAITAQKKGLSLDDIFTALQKGDLLSLQEQIEASNNPQDSQNEQEAVDESGNTGINE